MSSNRDRGALFRAQLLAWYDAHARQLPWRQFGAKKPRDPYPVWVSEIMLQQTRVAAVIAHYYEFLRRFPTAGKLAAAREASVLAAWSGLGYYRRARMLHAAAKVIVRKRGGEYPATAAEWRTLPGIGRYTAAAIASIAFGERIAVVDGNVERVLQRLSGERLAGEELWEAAEELVAPARPGDFNQAMMELGAMVCTPRAPACLTCPVVELCATRGELRGGVKAARQKKREIHYALDWRSDGGRDGRVFLVQRARNARLMPGMWELPEIPAGAEARCRQNGAIAALNSRATQRPGGDVKLAGGQQVPRPVRNDKANNGAQKPLFTLQHSITVTDYSVRVWRSAAPRGALGEWVGVERLERVALTGLARKILRKALGIVPRLDPIESPGSLRRVSL